MPAHRAECEDCHESYTDPDLLKVSEWAEDHEQSEFHDVIIERAVATDGGTERPWVADCRNCDYKRTFETGTQWKTARERAVQGGAGGHEGNNPGHEVDVRPANPATEHELNYVLVSRFKTRGVYHDPDPDNPNQPGCQCADSATRKWQRRSVETLSDRFTYCQYCDPEQNPAPKNNSGGELAARLRAMTSEEFDDQVATDGGAERPKPIKWSFHAVVHGADVDADCLALTGTGKPCSYNAYDSNDDPVCNTHARSDDPEIVDDGHQWARISDDADITVCVNCELVVDGKEPETAIDCPECGSEAGERCRDESSTFAAPIPPHPKRRRRAYEALGWFTPCEDNPAGDVDEDQQVLTDGGAKRFTAPYQSDPDDWSLDDPRHGFNVPDSVRRGGATGPQEREEIGNNGVALRSHAFKFRCEDCGEVRRFATSEFVTQYRCHDCGDIRWFRFDWDLNRRSDPDTERFEGGDET